MSNIKEVIINPNKPADVKFVQYDTGQKLYVKNSPDFDFTNTTEIQITDGTESAARYRFEPYGDGGIVDLPDTMFRNAGILKGYIFSVDVSGHTTEALISIGIRERPVYNEYISDADEEVVIPAGFEVIQNPESVTIKAYNTDGTVTEGTVENGSNGEPGAPGERGSDGISPEASVEQTATGAIITIKDARGTTTATLKNGHDGGGSASGPVTWVETSEASPAYPYRKYVTDVIETTTRQTTITPTYRFTDPDSGDAKYVHPSIVVDYSLPGLTQVKDNIYFTDNIELNETSGTAHPTVTVDSVTFDDPGVESYSSFDLVNPMIANGKIYAFLPQTIEFVYNQQSITATFSGEFLRTQVGTYQHTQTATKYLLGTQS